MTLTREEMETVIKSSAADEVWDIVTADSRVKTKLRKAGYKGQPDHQLSEPYEKFEVPFNLVRFGSVRGAQLRREAALRKGVKPPQMKSGSRENETQS